LGELRAVLTCRFATTLVGTVKMRSHTGVETDPSERT